MSLRASIDVGSNTLRLLIAEVRDNKIIEVYSERKITRLGDGTDSAGRLPDKNIEDSLTALKGFSAVISKYGVRKIRAVATSAVREAVNADIFIKKALNETGIAIEVIHGVKEAELTLKGILLSFEIKERGSKLIIDIGGGSTEWIIHTTGNSAVMGSIPVGVIKLSKRYLKSEPIDQADLDEMNNEIMSVLKNLHIKIGRYLDKNSFFIGTAGTFTTLASIDLKLEHYIREKVHMHKIPLDRLLRTGKELLALPLEERKKVKGLEPERADLIIPGLIFTINTMEYFGFHDLTVSDYGLLEGALLGTKETDEKNLSTA
jgi:exopolyphosphatase / guanosine-5'-triphosphate,3'-diphosphate pyrophosphatase